MMVIKELEILSAPCALIPVCAGFVVRASMLGLLHLGARARSVKVILQISFVPRCQLGNGMMFAALLAYAQVELFLVHRSVY
jgi:hypothetical protein